MIFNIETTRNQKDLCPFLQAKSSKKMKKQTLLQKQ